MAAFIIYDVAFNFFIPSTSVLHQTIHAILMIGVVILFLMSWRVYSIEYRFLRIVFVTYFISQILLYVVNAFVYPDFRTWLENFNNYDILTLVLTASTLGAIIYSWANLGPDS